MGRVPRHFHYVMTLVLEQNPLLSHLMSLGLFVFVHSWFEIVVFYLFVQDLGCTVYSVLFSHSLNQQGYG